MIKEFDFAKNLKYDGYQLGLPAMIYHFFYKKSSGGAIKSEIMPHQHSSDLTMPQLAEELPNSIIGKSKKWTVLF